MMNLNSRLAAEVVSIGLVFRRVLSDITSDLDKRKEERRKSTSGSFKTVRSIMMQVEDLCVFLGFFQACCVHMVSTSRDLTTPLIFCLMGGAWFPTRDRTIDEMTTSTSPNGNVLFENGKVSLFYPATSATKYHSNPKIEVKCQLFPLLAQRFDLLPEVVTKVYSGGSEALSKFLTDRFDPAYSSIREFLKIHDDFFTQRAASNSWLEATVLRRIYSTILAYLYFTEGISCDEYLASLIQMMHSPREAFADYVKIPSMKSLLDPNGEKYRDIEQRYHAKVKLNYWKMEVLDWKEKDELDANICFERLCRFVQNCLKKREISKIGDSFQFMCLFCDETFDTVIEYRQHPHIKDISPFRIQNGRMNSASQSKDQVNSESMQPTQPSQSISKPNESDERVENDSEKDETDSEELEQKVIERRSKNKFPEPYTKRRKI